MRKNSKVKIKKGFTLVETILASIILCGAVLALGAISVRSLGETKLNRQYETAMTVLDRQLTIIDYIGIGDFIESGHTEGDVEEFEPGYHWEITAQPRNIGNLYLVRVTVSWVDRNRPYSVSVDTMLNGSGKSIELERE